MIPTSDGSRVRARARVRSRVGVKVKRNELMRLVVTDFELHIALRLSHGAYSKPEIRVAFVGKDAHRQHDAGLLLQCGSRWCLQPSGPEARRRAAPGPSDAPSPH